MVIVSNREISPNFSVRKLSADVHFPHISLDIYGVLEFIKLFSHNIIIQDCILVSTHLFSKYIFFSRIAKDILYNETYRHKYRLIYKSILPAIIS